MVNVKNRERLGKLEKQLKPLQQKYVQEAWKKAKRIYNLNDGEERALAFAKVNAVDYESAFELARITPPAPWPFPKGKKSEKTKR